jgi:hypothetical protein
VEDVEVSVGLELEVDEAVLVSRQEHAELNLVGDDWHFDRNVGRPVVAV